MEGSTPHKLSADVMIPSTVSQSHHGHGSSPSTSRDEISPTLAGYSKQSSLHFSPVLEEDFERTIQIIRRVDEGHDHIHHARMLIDSGNKHENFISRELVDELGLNYRPPKTPLTARIVTKLFGWVGFGRRLGRKCASGKVRNIDGTLLRGQGGRVTIRWAGMNDMRIRKPVISFPPVFFETSHLIVDGCKAQVVLCCQEISRLGLTNAYTGAIVRPPTPDKSDAGYADYEARKRAKAELRNQPRGADTTTQANSNDPNGTSKK